jgi:hypothetical protein
VITDDFSSCLTQWTTAKGRYFGVSGGELTDSYSGENILISNTGKNIADGSITVDLKRCSGAPYTIGGILFRYQDVNNFYWVEVTQTALNLKKRTTGQTR